MSDFQPKGDYIELIKLLKHLNLVESGAMAKMVVKDGMVLVNGEVELRMRKKLKSGDVVEFNDEKIKIA